MMILAMRAMYLHGSSDIISMSLLPEDVFNIILEYIFFRKDTLTIILLYFFLEIILNIHAAGDFSLFYCSSEHMRVAQKSPVRVARGEDVHAARKVVS